MEWPYTNDDNKSPTYNLLISETAEEVLKYQGGINAAKSRSLRAKKGLISYSLLLLPEPDSIAVFRMIRHLLFSVSQQLQGALWKVRVFPLL